MHLSPTSSHIVPHCPTHSVCPTSVELGISHPIARSSPLPCLHRNYRRPKVVVLTDLVAVSAVTPSAQCQSLLLDVNKEKQNGPQRRSEVPGGQTVTQTTRIVSDAVRMLCRVPTRIVNVGWFRLTVNAGACSDVTQVKKTPAHSNIQTFRGLERRQLTSWDEIALSH